MSRPPPYGIGDHGVVGDCRSVALIRRDAQVDFLCWPRFDSDAVFASLLGGEGAWSVLPQGGHLWRSSQRYLEQTNVLVTDFESDHGAFRVVDWMPVVDDSEKDRTAMPEHELLRTIEGVRGEVEVRSELRLCPRFGAERIRLTAHPTLGIRGEARQGAFYIRAEAPMRIEPDACIATRFVLRPGTRYRFSLAYTAEAPAVLCALGEQTDGALARTVAWWRQWAARSTYRGPLAAEVVRGALTLKLLCYAPSGAVVAAPTTSLPEAAGGALNWDYRFCWLRDAAFTTRALLALGYYDEAQSFVDWLLHATRLTQPRLRVLYDVFGNPPAPEAELPLEGFGGARPVRIGNAADAQLQLDLQGEVIDAQAALFQATGELPDRETRAILARYGRWIAESWDKPDAGIWEIRSAPRRFTHSRILCWTALDRLIWLQGEGALPKLDLDPLTRARFRIREQIEERCWNDRLGSYVDEVDGDQVDVSLLLLPWYRYCSPQHPRVRSTITRILRELRAGPGLLYRNPELRAGGDGAFVAASFWAANVLLAQPKTEALGRDWLEAAAEAACNPLGLMAEEVDPKTGALLGNFPQAYSHVGLIHSALALEKLERRGVLTAEEVCA